MVHVEFGMAPEHVFLLVLSQYNVAQEFPHLSITWQIFSCSRLTCIHFEALMFVPFVFWVKIGLMLSCLKISKSSSSLQDARLHWLPLTQVSKLIAHLAQPRSSTPSIKSEARILYHSNPFLILLYQYLGHTHSAQTWSRLSSGENTVLYCPVL